MSAAAVCMQTAWSHENCKRLVHVLVCHNVFDVPAWLNFFSPAIDYFSPSETCFPQILAHCMYLSLRAILEKIGICNSTVSSVGVPGIVNKCVLGLSACKIHRLAWAWCLQFLFRDKGGDWTLWTAPSEFLWTLQVQISRGVFSKPPNTATIIQRAVTRQCTYCRLCVWPWHSIHCKSACPSIVQAFLSDPDVHDAGAEA